MREILAGIPTSTVLEQNVSTIFNPNSAVHWIPAFAGMTDKTVPTAESRVTALQSFVWIMRLFPLPPVRERGRVRVERRNEGEEN